jgi:hypothetical protein
MTEQFSGAVFITALFSFIQNSYLLISSPWELGFSFEEGMEGIQNSDHSIHLIVLLKGSMSSCMFCTWKVAVCGKCCLLSALKLCQHNGAAISKHHNRSGL